MFITPQALGKFAIIDGLPSLDLGDGNAIIGIEGATLGALRCEFPEATVRRVIPGQQPTIYTGTVTAVYKGIYEAAHLYDADVQTDAWFDSDRGWEISVEVPGHGLVLKWENKLSE